MSSKIINQEGNKLTIQIEVELDSSSMLSSEEQIAQAVQSAGLLATQRALEQFDTNGEQIEAKGKRMSSKGQQKKSTKHPTDN